MNRYQFSHDGFVIVQRGDFIYSDKAENFEADVGRSVIGVPGLIYVIDGQQCVISLDGNQTAHGLGAMEVVAVEFWIERVTDLLDAQSARRQSVMASAFAALTVDQRRAADYVQAGATVEALTVALWEMVVEGRGGTAAALQLKREAVKTAHPK